MGTAASGFEQQHCLVLSQKTMMTKLLPRRAHANSPCLVESASWSRSPVPHMLEQCHSRPLLRFEAWITPALGLGRARKISWGGRSALRDVSPRITRPLHQHFARHPKTNVRVTANWDVGRTSQVRAEPCLLYPQKRTPAERIVMSALCQKQTLALRKFPE
jgi:hypothetical protein